MRNFDEVWKRVLSYCSTTKEVTTLVRKNRNVIVGTGPDYVIVRSDFPEDKSVPKERKLIRRDFEYAWKTITSKGRISLDDLDPKLRHRKSIICTLLVKSGSVSVSGSPMNFRAIQ